MSDRLTPEQYAETEAERCERAVRALAAAIDADWNIPKGVDFTKVVEEALATPTGTEPK